MYKAILFDLDGTITASGEGITKCVQYAMQRLGVWEPDLRKLEAFIGPPLLEQFMSFCGFTKEQAECAVEYYRERYEKTGIYENRLYKGIPELLAHLRDAGYILAVASSKPEHYVRKILEYFQVAGYFHVIVGADIDHGRSRKEQVVAEALQRLQLADASQEAIMVGDREHDVYGARQMGLDCVAVTYGYGTKEELKHAGPLAMVNSIDELRDFF